MEAVRTGNVDNFPNDRCTIPVPFDGLTQYVLTVHMTARKPTFRTIRKAWRRTAGGFTVSCFFFTKSVREMQFLYAG